MVVDIIEDDVEKRRKFDCVLVVEFCDDGAEKRRGRMVLFELPVAIVIFPGSAVPFEASDSVGKSDVDGPVVTVECAESVASVEAAPNDVDTLKCVDVVVSEEPPGKRLLRNPPIPTSAVTPGPEIPTVSPELESTTTVAGGA